MLLESLASWLPRHGMLASNIVMAIAAAVTTYLVVYDRAVTQERDRAGRSGRVLGAQVPFVATTTKDGAACVSKLEFGVVRQSRLSMDLEDFELRPKALEFMAPYVVTAVRGLSSEFAKPERQDLRDAITAAVVTGADPAFERSGLRLDWLKLTSTICTKDTL